MKRYLILAFFLLLGCTSTSKYVGETTCPNVLFSSEHRNYIYGNSSPITFDNLSYSLDWYSDNIEIDGSGIQHIMRDFERQGSNNYVIN